MSARKNENFYPKLGGFTLIELLVVIAMIAILAGILFPVFAAARNKARKTTCLNNIKQIALAQIMYSQDYGETLIPFNNASSSTVEDLIAGLWTVVLQPYMKNSGILFCPNFDEASLIKAIEQPDCNGAGSARAFLPPLRTASQSVNGYYSHYGISYPRMLPTNAPSDYCDRTGSNPYANFAGTGWMSRGWSSVFRLQKLSEIVYPARTAYVCDAFVAMRPSGIQIGTAFGCEARFRHAGGGNFAFMDGHAECLPENPQAEKQMDEQGCWYQKWFTYDR